MYFLEQSATGNELSSYHIEARIAYWHCIKEDTREKWKDILQLYDQLLNINYSPVVALNRAYAIYKLSGPEIALVEAEKLKLEDDHFYFILLGELYRTVDSQKSRASFERAVDLARTQTEKDLIRAQHLSGGR
jgi:RNA polymerase sigma-70 factor (ECF subfamily)